MHDWTQAIYDATGIPLQEDDVKLAYDDGQWWLELHAIRVLAAGPSPDPRVVITPALHGLLVKAMEQRLSAIVPQVRRLVDQLDAEGSEKVDIAVVLADGAVSPHLDDHEFERGWPHFLLRLTAGGFDVEADLNPYAPDEPFEVHEVRRQAEVILQVARAS